MYTTEHTPQNLYRGEYFPSANAAAEQFQYRARLRSANSREIKRFGSLHCAQMQRQAAEMYAAAREALGLDL